MSVVNTGTIATGAFITTAPGGTASGVDLPNPDAAYGIFAQSVGGGGGTGGWSSAFKLGLGGETGQVNVSVSVGGSGGNAGRGDTVVVDNHGAISTTAERSHAIIAQSVGGGGGTGGMSINADLLVGRDAAAPVVNAVVGVGGHGGDGGTGGPVSVTNSASLDTSGAQSHGIYAHSVGGGGGSGGAVRNFTLSVGPNNDIKNPASVNLRLGIGGSGGTNNHGGAVTVTNSAAIHTRGEGSFGHLRLQHRRRGR